MTQPKIALALGSGGSRGFCHIGVLKVLERYGIKPQIITGSSMGSIAGGFYAKGMSIDDMEKAALEITQSALMDFDLLFIWKYSVLRGEKVERILKKFADNVLIEELPIKFAAVATDLLSGQVCVLDKGDLITAMRASMAIPGVFSPVEIDGKMLIDGGVLCRLPIKQAYDLGADIVIAVDALGKLRVGERPKQFIGLIERTFRVMDAAMTSACDTHCHYLITPDMGNKNEFVFKDNKAAIDAGEEAALKAISDIIRMIKTFKPRKRFLRNHHY